MAKPKRTHRSLTLKQKIEVLEAVQRKKKTKTEIASELGIPRSTLSTIIKNREKLLRAHDSGFFRNSRKRMRVAAWPELEKGLMMWLKKARNQNFPISGTLIKEKSASLAIRLGYKNFKASDGWLARFKNRHKLVFRAVCSEAGAVPPTETEDWNRDWLPNLILGYNPDDIYSADETGLFWNQLPNNTLTNYPCSGDKLSKVRMTILTCSNVSGSDKLKLLVIGKAKKPRCFTGIKTLPIEYEANAEAWMNSQLFTKWLYALDRKFKAKKRKVLLFLDNCSAHRDDVLDDLTSITVHFFPPNTTSVLQPMKGVIWNMKYLYRKHLMQRILLCLEDNEEYELDLLKAIHLISYSWNNVSPTTIQNCFEHAGFISNEPLEEGSSSIPKVEPDDSDELVVALRSRGYEIPNDFSFIEFVGIDQNAQTCHNLTDEDTIREICSQRDNENEASEDENMIDENAPLVKEPSNQEIMSAIETVKLFLTMQEDSEKELLILNQVEELAVESCLKKLKQTETVELLLPTRDDSEKELLFFNQVEERAMKSCLKRLKQMEIGEYFQPV